MMIKDLFLKDLRDYSDKTNKLKKVLIDQSHTCIYKIILSYLIHIETEFKGVLELL